MSFIKYTLTLIFLVFLSDVYGQYTRSEPFAVQFSGVVVTQDEKPEKLYHCHIPMSM
ncbi:MAG: hypothetical protein R2771_02610 [Saprospiraceae bacterium]